MTVLGLSTWLISLCTSDGFWKHMPHKWRDEPVGEWKGGEGWWHWFLCEFDGAQKQGIITLPNEATDILPWNIKVAIARH